MPVGRLVCMSNTGQELIVVRTMFKGRILTDKLHAIAHIRWRRSLHLYRRVDRLETKVVDCID